MNIIEKYNQDKETTIQADISEFLHFNFSNYIMQQLKCRKDPNVKKLLLLFPLQPDTRKSEIKKIIDKLENILSCDLLDDIKDEFRDIWDDYKWANSKDGKVVLKIEEWIKKARLCIPNEFPNAYIYIGRRFVNPISLKIGGYVQDENEINKIETYFNNMNPPVSILYSIKVYVE